MSDRLKKAGLNINISLDEARITSEIITINASELIRALFRYKGRSLDSKKLENLIKTQRKLKKLENTDENRIKIDNISKEIDGLIFVEDLVSVEFTNKSHYLSILKNNGFQINGTWYTPFMASAGMIRKNTALFINRNIKHPLMDILENGRNQSVPLVPAKFGAYFSLYSSSTYPVSFPKFAVIPDKTIETIQRVNFVEYKGIGVDDEITEMDYNLKCNAWDGQGLIKPSLVEKWSRELELNYNFSCAIIRAPFLKGLIVAFDLDKFAEEVAFKHNFTDIYGNEVDVREIDMVVSESMFKLWSSYDSTSDYVKNCHANKLGFSIAKMNSQYEKTYARTSYQFIQVLGLNDVQIAKLCEPTINWFRNISGLCAEDMLLYATGENNFKPKDFDKMDVTLKAILLKPSLTRDKYIQSKFIKTIEKKKKESFMGSILVNANYQFMVSDPFYQCSNMFNLNIDPVLKEKEHYSEYWLSHGVKRVSAVRSPIVHHSEFNVLNFKDNELANKWYNHIHSGIIYPANGVGMDFVIHGGADVDGDLICTINNEILPDGVIPSYPIVYESVKADKSVIDSRDDKKQVESQLNGYNSKVGFATNISSSMYALSEEFEKDTLEYKTIMNRLMIGRAIQGEIIDGVKGLKVPPFRNHWTKFNRINKSMTPEEIESTEFNNRIACEIRPAFFRFLYPHYMIRYKKEIRRYNLYSNLKFGKNFSEICESTNKSKEEEEMLAEYRKHSFFLDNNSIINKLSRYMQVNLSLIGKYSKKTSDEFDYKVLQNTSHPLVPYLIVKMKTMLEEYKSFKKGYRADFENMQENLDGFISQLRKKCSEEITTNESELADYAIEVTYGDETGMVEFPWRMFPDGILQNITESSSGIIHFPVQDDNGNISYLWNSYSIKEYSLNELNKGENEK